MRLLLALLLLICIETKAQTFVDVSGSVGFSPLNGTLYYGSGVSFFDVDEDGWDDITIAVPGSSTRYYKNNQGIFQLNYTFFNTGDSKGIMWFDFDEDGDNDLMITRRDGGVQLFRKNADGSFTDASAATNTVFSSNVWSWGLAAGDINRDAYLDVYIANYANSSAGYKNFFLLNNQNGFTAGQGYGTNLATKRAFQPVWLDLDGDLDQEIYIINDFETGNEYYKRTGPNLFSDFGATTGLSVQLDAMSNSWSDFDHDNDEDLYISDTPTGGNFFMINDSTTQTFSNQASSYGVGVHHWCWSSCWLDYNNDSWDDLIVTHRHISGNSDFGHFGFTNNGGTFTQFPVDSFPVFSWGFFSMAKGDYNNDGRYDVVMNSESNHFSKLLKNNSQAGNYFKFRCEGRVSNHNGFGTHYTYYVNGNKYSGYTKSCENYLSQYSQNIILGLGNATQIDSLELRWQCGVVDKYYNLPANTFQVFTEAETYLPIQVSRTYLCEGMDTVTLTLENWPIVNWSNGLSGNSIQVTQGGMYSATVSTGYGHTLVYTITVNEIQDLNYVSTVTQPTCYNGADASYSVFQNNVIVAEGSELNAGTYDATFTDILGCIVHVPIVIQEREPLSVQITTSNVSCFGESTGSATVVGIGGTSFVDSTLMSLQLMNLSAGVYDGLLLDSLGCEVAYSFEILQPTPMEASVLEYFICPYDSIEVNVLDGIYGGTLPYTLDSPELAYYTPGNYNLSGADANGCPLARELWVHAYDIPAIVELSSVPVSALAAGTASVVASTLTDTLAIIWENGATDFSIDVSVEGTYSFILTDANGCQIDSSVVVNFNGINEFENSKDWFIRNDELVYQGTQTLKNVGLYNAVGQQLMRLAVVVPGQAIPLSHWKGQMIFLRSGTYVARVIGL